MLGHEKDPLLVPVFKDLKELKVDVAYPFLMEVYRDHANERIATQEFVEIVRIVEAYVFRRAICSVPTNSLNKTFATLGREVKKDRYLESVKALFLSMRSYRRFPRDEEFMQRIQDRDLYNFRSRVYWLRKFENHGRKERVHLEDYTIEHIMPQNENLSAEWRADLGEGWATVQEKWLHTLGNLTLTGYNPEYGDNSFRKKRDMKGGFAESPLRLNAGLGALETWNEAEIKARAERLAHQAAEVWAAPDLPRDVLQSYQGEGPVASEYSIADHPNLTSGKMREIFETLRHEILALDPCVAEHFLKLYVAYKAETNFVDVIPQAKTLVLSLNVDPRDLSDPRGLVINVAGVGRWGNGDSEFRLSDAADVPYAMGLIRQALERQLSLEEGAN